MTEGHAKHKLGALMLSDPKLEVIDLFGLRNIGSNTKIPGKAKAMPVPTSMLVDASGKVLWMDQSENVQQRSDPDYVKSALQTHLG